MKYRKLNEVLIEWNESSKQDSDNVFLKSEDIEESLKYFVYRLDKKGRIKIFNGITPPAVGWPEFEKYKNKVRINGKYVELYDEGWTYDEFEPGEYRVYIKDIDKITNTDFIFCECNQLVSVFIPKSVTSIGYQAFSGCSGLTSVRIPSSVTTIDYKAFESCYKLMSVTIPNSVTSIGPGAFYGCSGLTSVNIPGSVTEIGDMAFYGCKKLKTIYIEDINKFNQIEVEDPQFADPRCYGAKLVELKK